MIMKNHTAPKNQTIGHRLFIACITALSVAFTTSLSRPAHADYIEPPNVPTNIRVPAGNKVFLVGHAVGTQQYFCRYPGTTAPWVLFGPQATLYDDDDKQIITHFLSPNPSPNDPLGSGTPRPTWQHSKDTSVVWAKKSTESSDSNFVEPGAIPWFLLEVVGDQDGPTDGDKLTATTFIQRLNTSGGVAPSTNCTLGDQALVDYEADYFFYRTAEDTTDNSD
jgi:hypothetical protein